MKTMTSSLPVRDAVSAGGVVWRRSPEGGLEVVLCGRRNDDLWVLPKGTPDAGEALEETALREVREETGLLVQQGESLGSIEYWFVSGGARIRKRVHHWLMEPVGGDVSRHDHEFDVVLWLPVGEAERRLTYENERKIMARAVSLLGEDL
jgi:8-oxo-dGTP pyrophosphatase MutT (NUDIX family)